MTRGTGKCGTITGRTWHLNNGTPVCQKCKDKHTRWQRAYKKQVYLQRGKMLIPALGTQRRIRALAALGHSFATIAELCGMNNPRSVGNILARGLVHRDTAARVRKVYERLSMIPGVNPLTRRRALAAGWPPPLAWDDIDNPQEIPSTEMDRIHEEALEERKRRQQTRRRMAHKHRVRAQQQEAA